MKICDGVIMLRWRAYVACERERENSQSVTETGYRADGCTKHTLRFAGIEDEVSAGGCDDRVRESGICVGRGDRSNAANLCTMANGRNRMCGLGLFYLFVFRGARGRGWRRGVRCTSPAPRGRGWLWLLARLPLHAPTPPLRALALPL